MKRILPQANSLDTVIKVFMFAGIKHNFTKEEIADYFNFDIRQSDYYLGACIYLGLFDEDLQLTETGRDIIENDLTHCKERIYELVITDSLASHFFAKVALFPSLGEKGIDNYAASLTRKQYDYSDAVIERRSSAMVGWCEEILDYIKKKTYNGKC